MTDDHQLYLSGQALYGDDLSQGEIEQWYLDEEEGYSSLGAGDASSYRYAYHALNRLHGFSKLDAGQIRHALGVGAAYGNEFEPIADRIERLTILDPSEAFSSTESVKGIPCRYVQPQPSGEMPFENGTFDLITSLGALHHIPNVSFVMKECARCLTADGVMLVREPIVSMGDWRNPRRGLTRNERGIPLDIFHEIIVQAGLRIRSSSLCVFPPLSALGKKLGWSVYSNPLLTRVDSVLATLFKPNLRYHATSVLQRFRPASVFLVLERDQG